MKGLKRTLLLSCFLATNVHAKPKVDFNAIIQIESSWQHNNLCQITPIALKDYNNYHAYKYSLKDLENPQVSMKIGYWLISERLPQLLKYFKIKPTVRRILIAYNAGILNAIKNKVPVITKRYLEKYKRLAQ